MALALLTHVQNFFFDLEASAQSNGSRDFLVLGLDFYLRVLGVWLPLSENARARGRDLV